jgi:3-phenylpropionate/trans-cinnamate dioxygenase ferredoxin reductase subunit
VFYFRSGKFIAVDSINRPMDHMIGRKLLAGGVDLSAEQAADESFDLKALVRSVSQSARH